MNLSCTTKAIKYLMFSFNFIFVITGIILIAVGATIHSNYNKYDLFLDGKYFSLPNLLIATGILIFIISFLGCYGALKESWLMLMAFSVLLGVIFVFEFSAGIAGYVLRDKTSGYLEDTFYSTMPKYGANNSAIAEMWDLIQQEFQCCGVKGPEDWVERLNHNASFDLPVSCCPSVSGTVGKFTCNNYNFTTDAPTKTTNVTPPTTTPAPKRKRNADDPGKTPKNDSINALASDGNITPTIVTSTPESSSSAATTSSSNAPSTSKVTTHPTTQATSSAATTSSSNPPSTSKVTTHPTTEATSSVTTSVLPSTSPPYRTGCESAFGSWVKDHAVDIGAVGFTLAVIQIGGIAFACHLSRQLKNRYYST